MPVPIIGRIHPTLTRLQCIPKRFPGLMLHQCRGHTLMAHIATGITGITDMTVGRATSITNTLIGKPETLVQLRWWSFNTEKSIKRTLQAMR
jgi:hypothetical protein